MTNFPLVGKICFVTYLFILVFSFYFLVYFNIRNINFKKYLQVTYDGLGIGHHFEGASIFIYKSPFYRQREYVKVKDEESEEDLNLNNEELFNSIQSESENLSESQKEREIGSYYQNYLKLHKKR